MPEPKESPPDGGLVSENLGGSSNNGNVAQIQDEIQCILCGMFFQRERHSDLVCPDCEQEGGLE